MTGKGVLANATTCHVFEALRLFNVPLAFEQRDGDSFITRLIEMIPVEIVVRNVAVGSYCKRNPDVEKGHRFNKPVVEFFFKTHDKTFRGHVLETDDPYMSFSDDGSRLAFHHPDKPINHERPMLEMNWELMSMDERRILNGQLTYCKFLALAVNKVLKELWGVIGGDLHDFKIECGYIADDFDTEIMVGDVIDCDSWRVMWHNQQLSKQPFREGMSTNELLPVYQLVEELTRQFPEIARHLDSGA